MTGVWVHVASADRVDVTERGDLARQMDEWLAQGREAVVLVTCHRAELYGIGDPPRLAGTQLYADAEAVDHLMRVAAGLESAIVGEDEVLHQVRTALKHAHRGRTVDFRLRRLFESAIAAGRKARSKRTTASGNLAQRAVDWMKSRTDLSGRMVVVAGAGRMGAALAHSLAASGAVVTVASRQKTRASSLARVHGGLGVTLAEGASLARYAAGVGVALGGPWAELDGLAAEGLPPIADISAPQAVPDSVRHRLNGDFLGIDSLYESAGSVPQAYISQAEALVARGAEEYWSWLERRAAMEAASPTS